MRRNLARLAACLVTVGVLVALVGGTAQASTSTRITWAYAQVVRWVDGDTVQTTAGNIRLIGVDTPEAGKPGASTATAWANRLAPRGSRVLLGNPVSVKDNDRYGRHLRYVVSRQVDVDRAQIVHGARARYDSKDGYQWHPRQAGYRAADARYRDYRGGWSAVKKPAAAKPMKPVAGTGNVCPSRYPVKGNDNSKIYHVPGQRFYKITNARHCFSSTSVAARSGYRAAKI
ncbi:MAG: thermonuclease family protein [Humibacillus sp.]|nr:thermonuclease family protein [Humibacillus sp.]MDN5778632.1 thermonuclease family protein [Humibacillus sp.]